MSSGLEAQIAYLAARRILILGLGREGLSTYRFLRQHFPRLPLVLADRLPVARLGTEVQEIYQHDEYCSFVTGDDYLDHLTGFDNIFKTPGIPPALPALQAARQSGTDITSNTRLFLALRAPSVVGITGTKGKSTTTSVIYDVLRQGSGEVILAGNIGIAPLSALTPRMSPAATFVTELSSYQLMDIEHSPHTAVLQNVVREHLNYHGTFEDYVEAKSRIMRFQQPGDLALFNADFPIPARIGRASAAQHYAFGFAPAEEPGCHLEGEWLVFRSGRTAERIMAVEDVPLRGRFNLYNVMPGIILGRVWGIARPAIEDAIRQFQPLEHRLQVVCEANGIQFVNDSLSTIPEAAMAAIDSVGERPIVLIAGGYDRGQDYRQLAERIRAAPVRALILFPDTGERLWESVLAAPGDRLPEHFHVTRMEEAVEHIFALAQPGDVVLLSPASASFSTFADYRDRGNQFARLVRERACAR